MLGFGKLKLNSNLILAPMAGVSDLPFRMINRALGCELAFVEMLNVRSISYRSRKTQQMMASNSSDRPLGVQILGREPKFILRALEVLSRYSFELLDFNAACPVRKVARRGEGAALMKDPKELSGILKLVVKNSPFPVTVKIRSGWDQDSINAQEVAAAAEDSGVKGIFIHGRTRTQGYSGKVDYKIIREVKKAVKIPVVASGDILSCSLAKKMFAETGCDGIAVARGALGNPWIFKEIQGFLLNGVIIERPPKSEITNLMLQHLNACVDFYGERAGVVIFRKFFSWYTKSWRKVRRLRDAFSRITSNSKAVEFISSSATQ